MMYVGDGNAVRRVWVKVAIQAYTLHETPTRNRQAYVTCLGSASVESTKILPAFNFRVSEAMMLRRTNLVVDIHSLKIVLLHEISKLVSQLLGVSVRASRLL